MGIGFVIFVGNEARWRREESGDRVMEIQIEIVGPQAERREGRRNILARTVNVATDRRGISSQSPE